MSYQVVGNRASANEEGGVRPKPLEVLAVPFGWGAGDPRTALAPAHIARSGLVKRLRRYAHVSTQSISTSKDRSHPNSPDGLFRRVLRTASQTARGVEQAVMAGNRFLVLGGDHSIAAGTWAGAARATRNSGPIGLIWIDAHMDAHVPETTPSGNWHGMPLAHLLGHGHPQLTQLAGGIPAVRPEHLCMVGVRSFEREEAALLTRLGVRVIDMREINRIGLAVAMHEALQVATSGTAGFGVSWDMDSIDPADAPGVGTPVAGGIDGEDLLRTLPSLVSHPACLGLEVVEYNPVLDTDGRTHALLTNVVSRWCSSIGCPKLPFAA